MSVSTEKIKISGKLPRMLEFNTGKTMWYLWCTKWHWDRLFGQYFRFELSVRTEGLLLAAVKKYTVSPSPKNEKAGVFFPRQYNIGKNRNKR
jgi:hypothetical protein